MLGIGFAFEDGEVVGIMGEDGGERARTCHYGKAALHLVHLELRQEYRQRYRDELFGADVGLVNHAGDIILDLIEKVKQGWVIEDGTGAAVWSGNFYLGTVAEITGEFLGHL